MGRVLQAYISVVSDERRVTVTTSKVTASSLSRQLKAAGLIVAEIGLKGRFHSPSHQHETEQITEFCNTHSPFHFPKTSAATLLNGSSSHDDHDPGRKPHEDILRSILLEQSDWYQIFVALLSSRLACDELTMTSFGPERCFPPSLLQKLGSQKIRLTDIDAGITWPSIKLPARSAPLEQNGGLMDQRIAVVGMACLVPGADDLEGFSQLLRRGKSQHMEVPAERFKFETAWRDVDPQRKWYGNFIQNHDTFDHKFFKKSPREMASTDPQQRLMLQVAYQAVEQSGYFNLPNRDKHIGCYIGVGLADYENNIACYPANAYSATGNLKSFTAGKISHYFGWTGPGLTIDTACSSSAVAVHQACRAILTGDCSAALVGGINIMTSPEWFQNLAGASFLSPTGQCKPFDSNADGYCRGEGVGAVFLKKLSKAVADSDQIIGVIPSTNVYQNENCTPITVPNVLSLANLFENVIQEAGVQAQQVTVVEAHGTGTQVGDPVEYDSVRKVFGGSKRPKPLSLGSVKGLVGHTESASGIIALIKILLMIFEGFIPPQPSFEKINASMSTSPSDQIEITTSLKAWNVDFRAALINNYGASGSNASLMVTQATQPQKSDYVHEALVPSPGAKHPFWFSTMDEQSLRRYITRFRRFIEAQGDSAKHWSIADLAFQTYRQSNRLLRQALIFSCSTIQELQEQLTGFENGHKNVAATVPPSPRPVILCFGGQVSTFVGLDRQVYDHVHILRRHLDECDSACHSLGLSGIFPEIFQRKPLKDLVKLQTALFAIQYSCAKSWIDCGVQVAAVVGHSFGELTALCVSGALSLEDTIKLIAGRAQLVRDGWGPEKGSMMAVEGDLGVVTRLLTESSRPHELDAAATIACFNGPRSFTLAGSTKAIDFITEFASNSSSFSSIKMKKLHVTNAFHSTLVEPLMADLEELGRELDFKEPSIRLERATETESTAFLTPKYVTDHMRNPVYFKHAVHRLSQIYDSCIWLEAGSNSTVTKMASRAQESPTTSYFQSVQITSDGGFQSLAETTANLWREGLNVSFWPHHPSQASEYSAFLLPPYQFEKYRHWMDLKPPPKAIVQTITQDTLPTRLWTFVGYQDKGNRSPRFKINTTTEEFQEYLRGHVIVQTASLCPSVLQLQIAVDALFSLLPSATISKMQPQLQGLQSHAPMGFDSSSDVWLDANTSNVDSLDWVFKITSNVAQSGHVPTLHVSGTISFRSGDDAKTQAEFEIYERLVTMNRCLNLLDSSDVDEVIQGRNIYRAFSEVVRYSDTFKCARKIVSKDNESAGRVVKKVTGNTWIDTGLLDSFCQVAGVYVNCMTDTPESDMYISDRVDQWIRSPKIRTCNGWPEVFNVFCCHRHPTEKQYISDVFVFDPRNGALLEVVLGIHYQRIPKETMRKVLAKLTPGLKASITPNAKIPAPPAPPGATLTEIPVTVKASEASKPSEATSTKLRQATSKPDIAPKVRSLVSTLSGLESEEIKDNSELGDIGIDSLMGMEVAREIEIAFNCTLDQSELLNVTDFTSLIKLIQKALGYDALDMDEDGGQVDSKEGEIESLNAEGVALQVNGLPHDIDLGAATMLEAFKKVKLATDQFIVDYKLAGYVELVLPTLNELCVIHILDAFDELGCSVRNAKLGETVERIKYLPRHEKFVQFLYDILEETARLVDIDGSQIIRTAISCPTRSAKVALEELVRIAPDHTYDYRLTYLTGVKLAECLTGKVDALQLIFGTPEGREIASGMYGKSPINVAWIKQMESFLERLLSPLPQDGGPIKILEMGSGTGGTTSAIVSLLASLRVPVEYTVTDLSSSLVASARKRFKEYRFVKFKALDIESPPSPELLHSQHIVIATNCVHATRRLSNSAKNIHDILRPDGMLMMLEMTETLPWIDLVFGLIEGWWLFEDGRRHALVPPTVWEDVLQQSGYGHVDWTEGKLPEGNVQRVIIALASGSRYDRAPLCPSPLQSLKTDVAARQEVIDAFVEKYTRTFSNSPPSHALNHTNTSDGLCVLVTGATGSLGAHLAAHFLSLSNVHTVVCLNRRSQKDPTLRQMEAFGSKGIPLDSESISKVKVLETNTAKPRLGLAGSDYDILIQNVTHVIHNAWPMSITRPIDAFETQFKTMANLIELAYEISSKRPKASQLGFQFISSVATVGFYPLWSGQTLVPEKPMTVQSVLPTGYAHAKLVCERMLDETLHKHPDRFRPMAVRIGQIAGSQHSGYWNPVEHLAFLIKSCQTLKKLPEFEGVRIHLPQASFSSFPSKMISKRKQTHSPLCLRLRLFLGVLSTVLSDA